MGDTSKLDIGALQALVALIEARSVTRAAERLDRTQSGTSHALRRLRTQFDDPLLVRISGGMQPTPRALELYERAQRILAEIEAMASGRERFDPATAERLFTIAADDNMSLHLLPPLLAALTRAAPGIDLQVASPPTDARRALESSDIDLLIGPREPDEPGLYTRILLKDRFVGIARADHPSIGKRPSLERYAEHHHALVAQRLPARSFVDEVLAEHGLRRRVVLRLPHFIACARVVATTDLISATSKRLIESLDDPRLRTFRLPFETVKISLHATWHERLHKDPAHRWLRELLADVAKA